MIKISEVYMDDEIKKAVMEVLDSGWFIHGKKIDKFENKFAEFVGTKYAIGVSNGTTAIQSVLEAICLKEGNEVLVPSHTAFPTIEPILQLKAKPVFVDIDKDTYTVDIKDLKNKITNKTKAIMPVHLYGHPADLDPIIELCEEKGIYLIEDCCQAHGAKYKNKRVGSYGIGGCFSFYPSKNLTVCGDGGMVTTNNKEIDEKIRMIRFHGSNQRFKHEILGHNYRLSEISAAIGIKQLEHLPKFTERRREIANTYIKNLSHLDIELPLEKEWAEHVYHLFVIRTNKRDELQKHLNSKEIMTGVHYPIPSHQQPIVMDNITLPTTEKYVEEILSLPMHPLLSDEDVECVTNHIIGFFKK